MFQYFDFDLFGRAIFTVLLFALAVIITLKICNTIEYVAWLKRVYKKDEPKKEESDDDFFFGPVKDWKDLK